MDEWYRPISVRSHNIWPQIIRAQMRISTRLTNDFSKKIENLEYAVSLHCTYYNFVWIHKTLKVTPAMEAGVTNRLWEIEDVVKLLENKEEGEVI